MSAAATGSPGDSTTEQYLILELYHNPHEYSSAEGHLPIIRAVCPSLEQAAELIGKKKINEVQQLVDKYNEGGTAGSFTQNLFVVKVPVNSFVDTMNLPRISVTESHLKNDTRQQLKAVMQNYNDIHSKVMKNGVSDRPNLQVDPNVYERDRRAREYELMQRMHIRPLWRGNAPVRRKNVVPVLGGNVPQPAAPVTVQQTYVPGSIGSGTTTGATEGDLGALQVPAIPPVGDKTVVNPPTTNPPTFQGTTTPTVSAPLAQPNAVPVASEIPNPVTTPVPLAPVVTGGALRNMITDSHGLTYEAPPVNTGSSATSRITM